MSRRQPVYIGANRIVTFVEDDIPVIADTRSIDSLDLILGFEMERDVLPIFKRLLRGNSVFVDVGANFGLYSAVALRTILPSTGKVFALEANPLTYEHLAWTISANQARDNDRVICRNLAVSNVSGQSVTLNFDPRVLGGASIDNCGDAAHQVAIEAITLDDLIPAEVIPTLIKIDVEGHEPFVVAGAAKTLARSPGVVLIIECFEPLLRYYGVKRFIDEVRIGHGLDIYLAGPGASLRRLRPDEYPEGDAYIFASRLSLAGLDRAAFSFFPGDLRMPGNEVLFYGPYAGVPRGHYSVRIIGRIEGTVRITVQSDFGRTIHCSGHISEENPEFAFRLDEDVVNFELVGGGETGSVLLERIDLYPLPDALPADSAAAIEANGTPSKARRWTGRIARRVQSALSFFST